MALLYYGWTEQRELAVHLIQLGYRGGDRDELFNSVPVPLLLDIIYARIVGRLSEDPERRAEFDEELWALTAGTINELHADKRKRDLAAVIDLQNGG